LTAVGKIKNNKKKNPSIFLRIPCGNTIENGMNNYWDMQRMYLDLL
jgi:hypothetical protein